MKAWQARVGWAGVLTAGMALGCGGGPGPAPGGSGGTGGAGATGGQTGSGAAGGGVVCTAGASEPCAYSGDPATLGKGLCKAGQRVCDADGHGFGPCQGEVVPASEVCGNGLDEDCDGAADDGCSCTPGSSEPCYTGPAATMGVGACVAGTHVCQADGSGYGPCTGQVLPAIEDCDAAKIDEDCDGQVNEEGASCACVPGAIEPCYEGPAGTQGVGSCKGGTRTCNPDGLGHGPCMGQVLPVLETCGGADVDCDGAPPALCGGQHVWSKRFGAAGEDFGFGLAVDAAGNVVICGGFEGSVDFGGGALVSAGSHDAFLAKYDASGQHLWSKRFGGSLWDEALAVAVDSAGNVLMTGRLRGTADFGGGPLPSAGDHDVVMAKYDASGQHLWSKRFGGALDDRAMAVAVDSANAVVVTGYFQGTVDFGGGPLASTGGDDIFVAKYDASGQHLWSKRFGGGSSDHGLAVKVGLADEVLLTGRFQGTADFGGGPLPSAGNSDIFMAKYAPSGQHLWSKRFGGASDDGGGGVAMTPTGEVLLAGSFQGTVDFGGGPLASAGDADIFVAKYDATGQHLWSKRFGGVYPDGATVAVGAGGAVLLTGSFRGTVDFGGGPLTSADTVNSDGFVAKYDASGQHLWSKTFGAAGVTPFSFGATVAVDPGENVLLTGLFYESVSFGGGPLVSAGYGDVFVTKLAP